MKIGYPCLNWTIGCKGDRTFRLKSYSEERLVETVRNNLECLHRMLQFNVVNDILFFRITSDLVPFASHPICKFDWQGFFRNEFEEIGEYIRSHSIRISMHPDQFTLINSLDLSVFERSVRELAYHSQVLDLLGLDTTAKIQIHVGGKYGDKVRSINRFVTRWGELDDTIKRRLVIENDDRLYTLADCLGINAETGTPILFDVFHHGTNSSGETIRQAFGLFTETWREDDGLPMVDYSSPGAAGKKGRHSDSIDLGHFAELLELSKPFDFDVMLEIKDKEESALKAVTLAQLDERFYIAGSSHG